MLEKIDSVLSELFKHQFKDYTINLKKKISVFPENDGLQYDFLWHTKLYQGGEKTFGIIFVNQLTEEFVKKISFVKSSILEIVVFYSKGDHKQYYRIDGVLFKHIFKLTKLDWIINSISPEFYNGININESDIFKPNINLEKFDIYQASGIKVSNVYNNSLSLKTDEIFTELLNEKVNDRVVLKKQVNFKPDIFLIGPTIDGKLPLKSLTYYYMCRLNLSITSYNILWFLVN